MTLSPSDATAALQDIKQMEHRSALLRGYQSASPHLMIWGVVWAIGYMLNYLLPAWGGLTWLPLVVLGVIGDIVAARADGRDGGLPDSAYAWFSAAYLMLVGGTIAVMQPHDPRQVAALNALVISAAYNIYGTIGAPRMTVIGVGIAGLTLPGYFVLGTLFLPWMAAVGGGGLVLSGFWLRRV
jgi:uncharacterized protein YceK